MTIFHKPLKRPNIRGLSPQAGGFRRRSNTSTSVGLSAWLMQILERLPCAQQVVTSHLLFRIILQYVTDFNPELDPVVRNAQYITNTNFHEFYLYS